MDVYPISKNRLTPKINTRGNRMAENRTICRLCLGITDDFTSILYTGNKYNTPPSIMIKSLVPEMYTGISHNPVICYDCLEDLYKCWQFRQKCLTTENRIGMYLGATHITPTSISLDRVVSFLKKIGEIKDGNLSNNPDTADPQSDTGEMPYEIALNKNLKEYVDASKNVLVTFKPQEAPLITAPEKPVEIVLNKNLKPATDSSKYIVVPEQPSVEKPHTPRLKPIDIAKLMDPNKINMFGMDIPSPKKIADKFDIQSKMDLQYPINNFDFNSSENFFNNDNQPSQSEILKPTRVLNREVAQRGIISSGFDFYQDAEQELENALPKSYIFKTSSLAEGTSQDNSQENRAGQINPIITIKDEPTESNENFGSTTPKVINDSQTFGAKNQPNIHGMPFMVHVSTQEDSDDEFCEDYPEPKKLPNILRSKPNLSSQEVRLEKAGKKRTRIRKRLKLVPIEDNEAVTRQEPSLATVRKNISPGRYPTAEMKQLFTPTIIPNLRQTLLTAANLRNIELKKSGTTVEQIEPTMGPTLQAPLEMRQSLGESRNNFEAGGLKVKQSEVNAAENTCPTVEPNQTPAQKEYKVGQVRLSIKQHRQNVTVASQNASVMEQNQFISTPARPNVITVGNTASTLPQMRPKITVKQNTFAEGQNQVVSRQMGSTVGQTGLISIQTSQNVPTAGHTQLISNQTGQHVTAVERNASALNQNQLALTQTKPSVTIVGQNMSTVEQNELVSTQTRQNVINVGQKASTVTVTQELVPTEIMPKIIYAGRYRSPMARNRLGSTQARQNVTIVAENSELCLKEMNDCEIPKGVGQHVVVQEPTVQETDCNIVGKMLQDPNKVKSYTSPKAIKIVGEVFRTAAIKKQEKAYAEKPNKKDYEVYEELTDLGDYIKDHDYLASPYVRNKIYYKCYNGMYLCSCLICDILHDSEDHFDHMSKHDTVCNICQRDLVNVFALNLHVKNHIRKCDKCLRTVTYPSYHSHSNTCKKLDTCQYTAMIHEEPPSPSSTANYETYEETLRNENEEKLQQLEIFDSDDDIPLINLLLQESEQSEDDLPLINLLPSEKRRKSLRNKQGENNLEKGLVESYSHLTLNILEECITSENHEDLEKISLEDLLKNQPFVYLEELRLPMGRVMELDSSETETADSDTIDNFETVLETTSKNVQEPKKMIFNSLPRQKRKGIKYPIFGKKRKRRAYQFKNRDETNKISTSPKAELVKNPFSARKGTRSSTRLKTRIEEIFQDVSEPTFEDSHENAAQPQHLEVSTQSDHETDELDKDIAHMDEEIHNLGLDITEIEKSMENVIKNVIQNVGTGEELTSETTTELELCEKEIQRLKMEIDTLKNTKKTKKIRKVSRTLKKKLKEQPDIPNDGSVSQELDILQNSDIDIEKQENTTINVNLSSEETLYLNMVEDSLENIEDDNELTINQTDSVQERSNNLERITIINEIEITKSNNDSESKSDKDIENLQLPDDKVLVNELDHKLTNTDTKEPNNFEHAAKSVDLDDKLTATDSDHKVTDLNTTEEKVAIESQSVIQTSPTSLEKLDGETMEDFFKRIEKISQDSDTSNQPRTRKRPRKSYAFVLDISKKRRKPKTNESNKELGHNFDQGSPQPTQTNQNVVLVTETNKEPSPIVDQGSSILTDIQSQTGQELIHTLNKNSISSTDLRQETTQNDQSGDLTTETNKEDISRKSAQNDVCEELSTKNLTQKPAKKIRTQKEGEKIKKYRKKYLFTDQKQKRRNKLRQAMSEGISLVATNVVKACQELKEEKIELKDSKNNPRTPGENDENTQEELIEIQQVLNADQISTKKVKTKPKKVVLPRNRMKSSNPKPKRKIENKRKRSKVDKNPKDHIGTTSNVTMIASDPYDFEKELSRSDESPSKLRETASQCSSPNIKIISNVQLKSESFKEEKDIKITEKTPNETLQSILLSMMPDVPKKSISTVKKNIKKIRKKPIIKAISKTAKTISAQKKIITAPVKSESVESSIDSIIEAVSKYKENNTTGEDDSAECQKVSDLLKISDTVTEELKKGKSVSKRIASIFSEGKSELKIKRDIQSPSSSSNNLTIVPRKPRPKKISAEKDSNLSKTENDSREASNKSEASKCKEKIIKKRKLTNKTQSNAPIGLTNEEVQTNDTKGLEDDSNSPKAKKIKSAAERDFSISSVDSTSKIMEDKDLKATKPLKRSRKLTKPQIHTNEVLDSNILKTIDAAPKQEKLTNLNVITTSNPANLDDFKDLKPGSDEYSLPKSLDGKTNNDQNNLNEAAKNITKKDLKPVLDKIDKFKGIKVKKITSETTSASEHIKELVSEKQEENKNNVTQEKSEVGNILQAELEPDKIKEIEVKEHTSETTFEENKNDDTQEKTDIENICGVEYKTEVIKVKKTASETISKQADIKEAENKDNTTHESTDPEKVLQEVDKEPDITKNIDDKHSENVKSVSFSSGTSNADMESLFLEEESGSDPEKLEIPEEPLGKIGD